MGLKWSLLLLQLLNDEWILCYSKHVWHSADGPQRDVQVTLRVRDHLTRHHEQLRATCLVSTSCAARRSRTSTCPYHRTLHIVLPLTYTTHAGSRTPYQYTTRSPTLYPPPQLHYNHLPPSPAPQYIQFIREPPRPSPAVRRDFSASPLAAVEAANLRRGNS